MHKPNAIMQQSSGCSMETGDDTAHSEVTNDLSVPHLMCRRTEVTSTSAQHCCGVFRDSCTEYKTADLLTYLLYNLIYTATERQSNQYCKSNKNKH